VTKQRIMQQLQHKGFRLTRARQAVIDVILNEEGMLTPEKVLEKAAPDCCSLGLATVYRTLNLLEDLGFIRRIHLDDGCHGYARTSLDHSHHLICRSCSQVVEFEGLERIETFIKHLEAETGYTVDDHMLELVGLCPECRTHAPSIHSNH